MEGCRNYKYKWAIFAIIGSIVIGYLSNKCEENLSIRYQFTKEMGREALTNLIMLTTAFPLLQATTPPKDVMALQGLSPVDPTSFSRPELAVVSHLFINLTANFNKKTFSGNVDLTIEKIVKDTPEVILDVKDLKISKIINKNTKQEIKYTLAEAVGEFGSKLTIELPPESDQTVISICYETSPEASGLQWLTPSQTAGKVHPYLFSQFQAIHARSVIPCQDTPAVKTPYTATITAPKALTVLMSAIRKATEIVDDVTKRSDFEQKIPVPAYLIAIAIGALESRKLGPRSHVWAEKEIVDAAAYEFAQTEHQLKTAEDICGPYVWTVYDLLVLPPSFPFGGMENPCLTFVTPTLLAGDQSLANVVAHEIAHSWTGNLITNKNFEHFWLNEGFTVFVERKIKGRLSSSQDQDFDAYGRVSELRETVKALGENNPLTKLVVDLKNHTHPDDAFSTVPYEKGQTFLRYLETIVGGSSKFEPFLRKYFDAFKYKSIVTDDFKDFFENYFADTPEIKSVDWDKWLYTPGMPPVIPDYDKSRAQVCDGMLKKLIDWNGKDVFPISAIEAKKLTADQQIYLLQKIVDSEPQSIDKLKALDEVFGFSKIKNAEIKYRWFRAGLKAHWDIVIEPVLEWVNEVGRMKYVRPLYVALYAWEEARSKAIDNFKSNKQFMMHVVSYTVAKDLHLRS